MKYIIMFFCIIFCIIGDGALWLVGKMSELVRYGTEKVLELESREPHGAHEKSRLLLAEGSNRRHMENSESCEWPNVIYAPYDWAKEAENEA